MVGEILGKKRGVRTKGSQGFWRSNRSGPKFNQRGGRSFKALVELSWNLGGGGILEYLGTPFW